MTYGQQPGYRPPANGRPGYGQQPPPPPPYGAPQGPPPGPYGAPPSYPPPPRRRAEVPTGGPVSDEDERWAVPAYIGMFVGGPVAPVIVYALRGRTSPFARFHAAQALNLFIVSTVCNLIALALVYRLAVPGLLIALLIVAGESFCVIRAAIGANRCEWFRLPAIVAWPIIR